MTETRIIHCNVCKRELSGEDIVSRKGLFQEANHDVCPPCERTIRVFLDGDVAWEPRAVFTVPKEEPSDG